MKQDFDSIKESFEKLRLDLLATNLALQAISATLPAEQQRQMLAAFAALAVQQEQTAERMQLPDLVTRMQAAHQRQYSALEGAQKMKEAGRL
jgi:hypothetical protein